MARAGFNAPSRTEHAYDMSVVGRLPTQHWLPLKGNFPRLSLEQAWSFVPIASFDHHWLLQFYYIKNCPLCTGLVFFRKLFNISMLMRTCKHSNHGWIIWILMALIQAFKVGSCKRQAIWSFRPHHRFGRIGDLTIPLATEFAVRNWFRVWCLLEWPTTKWGSYDNHNGWVDEKRIWH